MRAPSLSQLARLEAARSQTDTCIQAAQAFKELIEGKWGPKAHKPRKMAIHAILRLSEGLCHRALKDHDTSSACFMAAAALATRASQLAARDLAKALAS